MMLKVLFTLKTRPGPKLTQPLSAGHFGGPAANNNDDYVNNVGYKVISTHHSALPLVPD